MGNADEIVKRSHTTAKKDHWKMHKVILPLFINIKAKEGVRKINMNRILRVIEIRQKYHRNIWKDSIRALKKLRLHKKMLVKNIVSSHQINKPFTTHQ